MEYAVLYDPHGTYSVIERASLRSRSDYDYTVYLSGLAKDKAQEIANAMNNRTPDMGPE